MPDTSKADFKDYICRPFCSFFREGAKEDMACRGALVVVDLVRRGRIEQASIRRQDRQDDGCGRHDRDLDETVCRSCDFRAADCDFQSEENRDTAPPCGGYRLLYLLKVSGCDIAGDLKEGIG